MEKEGRLGIVLVAWANAPERKLRRWVKFPETNVPFEAHAWGRIGKQFVSALLGRVTVITPFDRYRPVFPLRCAGKCGACQIGAIAEQLFLQIRSLGVRTHSAELLMIKILAGYYGSPIVTHGQPRLGNSG